MKDKKLVFKILGGLLGFIYALIAAICTVNPEFITGRVRTVSYEK